MRMFIWHPAAKYCRVYLDGKPARYCIDADDEAGWAKCYKADEHGIIVNRDAADGEELEVETLHGEVRFEWSRCKTAEKP